MASKPLLASTTSQPPQRARKLRRLEHGANESTGRDRVLHNQDPAHGSSLKSVLRTRGREGDNSARQRTPMPVTRHDACSTPGRLPRLARVSPAATRIPTPRRSSSATRSSRARSRRPTSRSSRARFDRSGCSCGASSWSWTTSTPSPARCASSRGARLALHERRRGPHARRRHRRSRGEGVRRPRRLVARDGGDATRAL